MVAADERRMIESVFALGDTPAREVMVPRTAMIWIESDKSATQATTLAVCSGYSRIPVIGENVDDIVGVVYLKDLVQHTFFSPDHGRDTVVSQVMRPAVFVLGTPSRWTRYCVKCSVTVTTWLCWSTSTVR